MTNIAEYARFFKEYYKNSPEDGGISLNISTVSTIHFYDLRPLYMWLERQS